MKKIILNIGLLIAVTSSFTLSAEELPVTERLVDTLSELAGGPHAGMRSNHAKGLMVTGYFEASKEAAEITYAPHFNIPKSDIVVRFSNASGVPDIADTSPDGFPKGMAIRFMLPEEEYTDIVVISVDRFPVKTPEDFLGLLTAIKDSANSKAKPTPIEAFLEAHPETLTFVQLPKPAPVSYATEKFHGINAFEFENEQGNTVYGRYLITPLNGPEYLSDEEREKAANNYLLDELPVRLKDAGEAKFTIALQIAEAGDAITDPTIVWPAERKMVQLGTLTLTEIMADGPSYEKANMFNPLAIPEGISPTEDPILLARPASYGVSFGRRLNPE
ncbi:catalase family peroxidase [Methylophaga pinxianii]|uniref:catalase family peroxidase n=1 Tax=Methylophaga pinxianii TaxID=2881052 RepID=UPI001CF572C9|nr:catalase family peroxidase [Methylophaga pinxianii]MCB2426434.1 catalase family peroxidase [Methylophaga pinxianii]UPH45005.1 catalase family peroxidase [Methylophaga pinxianii]